MKEPLRQEPVPSFLNLRYHDVSEGERLNETSRSSQIAPEKRIFFAVMETAVASIDRATWSKDIKTQSEAQRVHDWIMSDSMDWVFSFANCCEVMNIDCATVRRLLLKRAKSKPKRPKKRNWKQG